MLFMERHGSEKWGVIGNYTLNSPSYRKAYSPVTWRMGILTP